MKIVKRFYCNSIRIDCYKQGKKACEIYPAELSAEELALALELQAYQGRVCQEKEEEKP